MISINDFKRIEMKIGTILVAEYIEGADKLLRLLVDFGIKGKKPKTESEARSAPRSESGSVTGVAAAESPTTGVSVEEVGEERDIRQIISGIREYYAPEQLIGTQCPFVTNLESRTLRGLTSNGMILAVKTQNGGAILLHPDKQTEAGNALS